MTLSDIPALLRAVKDECQKWNAKGDPWFRGEPETATPLLPKLYRKGENHYNENELVQTFRSMGPTYSVSTVTPPPRENNNEWLFLMQHTGVPTRLLDWSQGLLQALFFALQEDRPILWMLDPYQLNSLSFDSSQDSDEFPIHWGNEASPAQANIQAAFRHDQGCREYPAAFLPTYIHPRMAAQKSTFTVHGKLKVSIAAIDGLTHLAKLSIGPESKEGMLADLRLLGVTYSSIFPDIDGLAREIATK